MFRPGHERRTNLYKRSPIPIKLEVARQVKAAGVKNPETADNMRKSIQGVRRSGTQRMLSPRDAKTLNLTGNNGYVMASESKKPYEMGHSVTRHHSSGGSSGGGISGNRRPSAVAKDIHKGADRYSMKTWNS